MIHIRTTRISSRLDSLFFISSFRRILVLYCKTVSASRPDGSHIKRTYDRSTYETQSCIEYIRLIACLIVVACHVNFQLVSTADTAGLKTFYFCVFSDGVAIFWMITGCFLFQNSRLLPLIKRALTKVLLPTLLLFMLCLAISGWHLPVKYFDHTWYVFVYLTVIILFPLLKPFAGFLDRGKGRDLAFLCISLLLFLLNDLMENRLLFFGFTPLTGFLPRRQRSSGDIFSTGESGQGGSLRRFFSFLP